ncbi:MAG: hypothetical protein Q9171_005363 [Xanthocarpia ochracea]
MVDDNCEVSGIVDWELSTPLPFGMGFCRIHTLAGEFSEKKFHMSPQFEDAEKVFWQEIWGGIPQSVREFLRANWEAVQSAVTLGTLLDAFQLEEGKLGPYNPVVVEALPKLLTYRLPLKRGASSPSMVKWKIKGIIDCGRSDLPATATLASTPLVWLWSWMDSDKELLDGDAQGHFLTSALEKVLPTLRTPMVAEDGLGGCGSLSQNGLSSTWFIIDLYEQLAGGMGSQAEEGRERSQDNPHSSKNKWETKKHSGKAKTVGPRFEIAVRMIGRMDSPPSSVLAFGNVPR